MVGEARVLQGVFDEEEVGLSDGVAAKGEFEGKLALGYAEGGDVPLAVVVNEGDDTDGNFADGGGEADEFVELGFGLGVEEVEAMDGGETLGVVDLMQRLDVWTQRISD
jgi:hypothetical protein